MSEADEGREIRTPESAWLSLEKEQGNMQVASTPDKLCAMARSRHKLNIYLIPAVVAMGLAIASGLLYNVYKVDQPWIRTGQAWTLGVLVYLLASQFERRDRKGIDEPCARFLERQHEERRNDYLRIKRRLFLFIPGIAACWLGRPSLARSSGTLLFLTIGIALTLVWFALGKAADKAMRDRDEVIQSIGAGSSD